MATEIELPDGTILEAPDGADPSAVAKAYLSKQRAGDQASQPKPGYVARTGRALADYAKTLGMTAMTKPWEIPRAITEQNLSLASGMIAAPANDLINAGLEAADLPTKDVIPTYQPRTEMGQSMLRAGGEIMSPVNAAVDYATDINNPDAGVRATGHLMRAASSILPLVGNKGLPRSIPKPARAVPRTAAEIRTEANAAYARADELGKGEIVKQDSLGGLTQKLERRLADEAFDPDLEPMTAFAYNKLLEESTKPGTVGHSPQGLEVLRRKLLKAEGGAARAGNANDARQVGQMIDDFDDWADNLVEGKDVLTSGAKTSEAMAARSEARAAWATMKRTQTIEDLVERARDSAPALSQTGFENALRIEFKSLVRNPRRMRQFNAEEKAALQKVARGGPAQWVARRVASIAPRGPVSATAATVLSGGPGGTAALMGVGEAGALAARLMRLSDVEAARTLVSNGRNVAPQAARPAFAGPTRAAVRASATVPPALSAEEIERQRARMYRFGGVLD